MKPKSKWQWYHGVAFLSAVVGLGVAYYLSANGVPSSDEDEQPKSETPKNVRAIYRADLKGLTASNASLEQVLALLEDVMASQKEMKELIGRLTTELAAEFAEHEAKAKAAAAAENRKEVELPPINLRALFEKVQSQVPPDPLDLLSIRMPEFDRMLDNYGDEEPVRKAIAVIMGAPGADDGSRPSASDDSKDLPLSPAKLIEIHRFMLDQIKQIVLPAMEKEKESSPQGLSFEPRVVTVAVQAYVSAKVMNHFNVTSEQVEQSTTEQQLALSVDQSFQAITMELQVVMHTLLGASD